MTPSEMMAHLDQICERIQLGLDALSVPTDLHLAVVGRTALRLAKHEVAVLKDEVLLSTLVQSYKIPDTTGRRPPKKRATAQRPK